MVQALVRTFDNTHRRHRFRADMKNQTSSLCQWSEKEIGEAIGRTLPACPHRHALQIRKIIAGRHWLGVKLSAIVEQVAVNTIRHDLTDYDDLIDRHGLDPEEARVAIEDEIADILRDWKRTS